MSAGRLLVIDADLNPRLATEARRRGRNACSLQALRLKDNKDALMVAEVFRRFDDPVLVSGDDHMPEQHPEALALVQATVAIVTPWNQDESLLEYDWSDNHPEDAWEREIVHRWLHRIQTQVSGTIVRYFPSGPRPWRPRRR